MYYSSFSLLSLFIHIIINFDILRKSREDSAIRIQYRRFLFSVMVYYVSDIMWGFLYDWKMITLAYIDTVVYFIAMVLSVFLWTQFVVKYLNRKILFGKILTICGAVIVFFEIVVLIINCFVPIVFSFQPDGTYMAAQARYITLVVQILLFLATSVYALVLAVKMEKKEKHYYRMIGYSGIIMTVFIILQTLEPLLPFYAIGCLLTTCIIHAFIVEDLKAVYNQKLGEAHQMVYRDSLTGVKNKRAYTEATDRMNQRIESEDISEFGVVVFDLNGLKEVNDNFGHEIGDRYIREASRLICKQYAHSPVYRIGGDEFVAVLQGEDYKNREELIESFDEQIDRNQKTDDVVVSSGIAVFDPKKDKDYQSVFDRADKKMYARKNQLKKKKKTGDGS